MLDSLAKLGSSSTAMIVLFYLFALTAAGSAIAVVASRNIVRTAVYLLFTLASVAGLYFLLNAEFLAAVQLVVYVGGTLILIIFGVMLTSKSPKAHWEPKKVELLIAIGAGIILASSLIMAIQYADLTKEVPQVAETYPMEMMGKALLGDYLVPFELASVLLLVVMIGAAYLAKGRKKQETP